MPDPDERFISIVARLGLLSAAQLDALRTEQDKRAAAGEDMSLEEIADDAGLLGDQQWDRVLKERVFLKIRDEEEIFAALVVAQGLTTQAEVDTCMREQEGAFRAGAKVPRLGELLVERGRLDRRQDADILELIEAEGRSALKRFQAATAAPKPAAESPPPASAPAPAPVQAQATAPVPKTAQPRATQSKAAQSKAASPKAKVPSRGPERAPGQAPAGEERERNGGGGGGWVFGRIAVEKGYVTQGQINECLKEQLLLSAEGKQKRLGELLVGKGYLSSRQVEEILAIQAWREKEKGDRLYGKIAVANRFASQRDVDEALQVQRDARRRGQKPPPMGEILLERGAIFYLEHLAVLKMQVRLAQQEAADADADADKEDGA